MSQPPYSKPLFCGRKVSTADKRDRHPLDQHRATGPSRPRLVMPPDLGEDVADPPTVRGGSTEIGEPGKPLTWDDVQSAIVELGERDCGYEGTKGVTALPTVRGGSAIAFLAADDPSEPGPSAPPPYPAGDVPPWPDAGLEEVLAGFPLRQPTDFDDFMRRDSPRHLRAKALNATLNALCAEFAEFAFGKVEQSVSADHSFLLATVQLRLRDTATAACRLAQAERLAAHPVTVRGEL